MKRFILLLPVVLLVAYVSALQATTILVPSQQPTIQAGIDAAVDGDTVLVANGTYTGDGNRDIDFLGKAIFVMSENGPEVTIIDCKGAGRGFYFHSNETYNSVVQGFTIINGYHYYGGGMYNEYSSPTVINCTFSGNSAGYGGGMFNSNSSPTVSNCTFVGNSAGIRGGGMNNIVNSSPAVTNCMFTGNTAGGGPTLTSGGGMYNAWNCNPTVTNCTFSGNDANFGGGMCNRYDSNPTVTNCIFSGNTADNYGGGMNNNNSSNPTVTNCTFSENHGTYGGGMYNDDSSPTVTNCTFSRNSAYYGGGMLNDYSNPTVTNCILWGDLPDEIYNQYGSTPIVTYSNVEGGYPGEGNIDEDPMFVLADKDDYRLLWESPCIDTGDPILLDPDGTRSDMGAHYFNQDDFLTLYLTPDATEVSPGDQLGVTYTAINRWDSPEPCWLLSQVFLPGGSSLNVLGPDQYTLPADYTAQVHITHPVPNLAPAGVYEYLSQIGIPPGTLYDEDSFTFKVIE